MSAPVNNPPAFPNLSGKELRTLQLAASFGGMYRGVQSDVIPNKRLRKLLALGLVREECPHNPVHKCRTVTTEAGDKVLRARAAALVGAGE